MPESCTIPPPVEKQYLIDYIPYLLTADKKSNEAYTYGSRLCNTWSGELENAGFNQITEIIETYKRNGHRNNQMVLQIAQPNDLSLNDPPCLRHIDTRIQDNKLHFFPYFRSWDLWGGFPANLAAISVLQEYMASEINIEQGEMICTSKGLHIYGYVEELAKIRIGEKE
jgi:thymidylate synthase